MKSKWHLFMAIGLILFLVSSVVGCTQEPTPVPSQPEPAPASAPTTPLPTPAPAPDKPISTTKDELEKDYQQHFEQGNMYLDQEQWDKAIAEYTQARKLAPDNAEALVGRAIANAWAGNYKQAENDFNTAYSMSYEKFMTADADVAWGIAITAQHSCSLDEAEYLFGRAISVDSDNPDAYTGRALMHLKEAYCWGIEYESSGARHLRQAISDFDKAVELDPDGIQGRIKRFNFEGDMAFLPNYIEANKRRGELLVSAYHYYSRALEAYDRVLEVCPDDVEALIGRGNAYMGLQQYDLALYDFDKASELAPDNPHAYAGCTSADQLPFIQGNIYLEQRAWDEAITEYTKAIELNPEYANAYAKRAVAYLEDCNYHLWGFCEYGRVIADCEKAKTLNPAITLDTKLAYAYSQQGDCHYDNREYEESIINYTKALELDPNISCRRPIDVYWGLIYDSLTCHEYDKAIEYANKAIELNTGDNDYYYRQLAEAYYGRGYDHFRHSGFPFDEAIADYTRAIELDPTNAEYYLSRAYIYETLAFSHYEWGRVAEGKNSTNKAIADYRQALELSQDAWQKEQILKKIEELL